MICRACILSLALACGVGTKLTQLVLMTIKYHPQMDHMTIIPSDGPPLPRSGDRSCPGNQRSAKLDLWIMEASIVWRKFDNLIVEYNQRI